MINKINPYRVVIDDHIFKVEPIYGERKIGRISTILHQPGASNLIKIVVERINISQGIVDKYRIQVLNSNKKIEKTNEYTENEYVNIPLWAHSFIQKMSNYMDIVGL